MIQFPFTAIVGMEDAKRSLIYHAIDPRIGGTLFLGHRGCAKSTLVRSFAELLRSASNQTVPFIEVPLGTTEDRLLGSVDAEALVEKRKWAGRIGLIEEAHGGVLYIDEINLLPDHLADYILDSAASGRYRMERDGITRLVESRYILVGTMNPEEGDLRPQLSDRFAHGVLIQDDFSPEQRIEIVKRRIAFDDEPAKFIAGFASSMSELGARVSLARERLAEVFVSDDQRMAVAAKGRELKLEGLRAELAVVRTARCAAAFNDRSSVTERDLEEAWRLCLGHRHADNSAVPKSPSPPPAAPSFEKRATATSSAPLDSRSDPKLLSLFHARLHHPLLDCLRGISTDSGAAFVRSTKGAILEQSSGPIAWLETLLSATRNGWLDDRSPIRLRHRLPSTRRNFWCFLDASRSTGMNQFLDAARDAVGGVVPQVKSARFHLLILAAGKIRWGARNASARSFVKALQELQEASGKSFIIEALARLHRARLGKGTSPKDRIVILSDGLASPAPGERPAATMVRLRQTLQRLARTPTPVAWLHPAPKRGLKRWVPKLLRGLPFARIEL